MKASEIMSPIPGSCSLHDSAADVARVMLGSECGCVPVVDDSGCLLGVITDRDLAIRPFIEGTGAAAKVPDLMTLGLGCCGTDDDVRDVERTMADSEVRRVPVVDGAGCCVGIISQANLERAAPDLRALQ
jgi:CBS domain-containing protein